MIGLRKSSSRIPTARSIARAGARWGPSVTSAERGLSRRYSASLIAGALLRLSRSFARSVPHLPRPAERTPNEFVIQRGVGSTDERRGGSLVAYRGSIHAHAGARGEQRSR